MRCSSTNGSNGEATAEAGDARGVEWLTASTLCEATAEAGDAGRKSGMGRQSDTMLDLLGLPEPKRKLERNVRETDSDRVVKLKPALNWPYHKQALV